MEEARTLFQEALALVDAADYATALQKFERVALYKRTPQVGYYVALCHEKLGMLVLSLGEYQRALTDARAAGLDDVASEISDAIAQLEPRIPRLTIVRGDGAATAAISVDGKMVGDAAVGKPMPFDPGTRTIVAATAGFVPFRRDVRLVEGQTVSVEVVLDVPVPEQAPTEVSQNSSTLKTMAWVATGIGVAGLGASAYFAYARSKAISDLDDACENRRKCPQSMRGRFDEGRRDTLFVNTGLAVGAAGLVAGTVLFIVSPSTDHRTVTQPSQSGQRSQPSLTMRVEPPPGGWAGIRVDGTF